MSASQLLNIGVSTLKYRVNSKSEKFSQYYYI